MNKINEMSPNNCGVPASAVNSSILSGSLTGWASRVFSFFKFDDVIRDTLNNDSVIVASRESDAAMGMVGTKQIIAYSLYSQYLVAFNSTKVMYKKLESIRDQYLVHAVLQTLVDDSMAQDPRTGDVFTVSIKENHPKSDKANAESKKFEKKLKLDRILSTVIEDAIFWGEYPMTLEGKMKQDEEEGEDDEDELGLYPTTSLLDKKKKSKKKPSKEEKNKEYGVTRILDANPPGTLFGIYNNIDPEYFIRIKKGLRHSVESKPERVPSHKVWHISIFPGKIRFSLGFGAYFSDDSNYISHHFRIGRPLFYCTYNKILELEAFENAQLAKEFSDLKRRGMVRVEAPAGLDLDQLKVFSQYYEKILNEGVTTELQDIQGLNAISNMMIGLSNVRVVPSQPDRGAMSPIDMRLAKEDTNVEVVDRRQVILSSIGIPYEYIFGAAGTPGTTNLRQYIRYSRLCRQIQDGVTLSLQRLYKAHLLNLDIEVELDDIEVKFYNSINIAELDKLEFVDANISLLKNFDTFINGLASDENTGQYVDVAEKMRYYSKIISSMEGVGNVIVVPKGSKKMALTPGADKDTTAAPVSGGAGAIIKPETPEPASIVKPTAAGKYDSFERLAVYEDRYPVLQIINFMKDFFATNNKYSYINWINEASNRYPTVPSSILVDIKNEVLSILGMKGVA